MPFKNGKYKHENGFTIIVSNNEVLVSPNHPLTLRISELFDASKWKEVLEND